MNIDRQFTYIASELYTDIKFNEDKEKNPIYVKEEEQCPRVFSNVEDTIDDFLYENNYVKDKDSKIFFHKTLDQNTGKEIATICFNRILLPDRSIPTDLDMYRWEHNDLIYHKHTYSMMIYEFKCRPLTLRMIKMNANVEKYC